MNRFLLSTTLLLLAGLCGQSVHAAPQYNTSVTITSPAQNQVFTAYSPSVTVTVPIVITSQYVEVNKAAPSTFISIQWVMYDRSSPVFANDQSNGPTAVMTDQSGHFLRYVNNNHTGIIYGSIPNVPPGNYAVLGESTIQDATGQPYTNVTVTNFSVNSAI